MGILFSNEILESIRGELITARTSVQVITAYCKEKTLILLDNYIGAEVTEKRLLLRFRMNDIVKGSTDFSVLQYGMEHGWKVFIRFDLHAKTYIIDNKRGIIGSANTTISGLGIGQNSNMEMATLIDVEENDIIKIDRLFNDAILVDDSLARQLQKQIQDTHVLNAEEVCSWDTSIMNLFHPHITTLFSYELPEKCTLEYGDYIPFLDIYYYEDIDKIKNLFKWSNSYLWLKETLRKNGRCLYFGELCIELHSTLVSDPKPYRRDVKIMLSNLLGLIEKLEMEEIVIDRPNYSQRVRLK